MAEPSIPLFSDFHFNGSIIKGSNLGNNTRLGMFDASEKAAVHPFFWVNRPGSEGNRNKGERG